MHGGRITAYAQTTSSAAVIQEINYQPIQNSATVLVPEVGELVSASQIVAVLLTALAGVAASPAVGIVLVIGGATLLLTASSVDDKGSEDDKKSEGDSKADPMEKREPRVNHKTDNSRKDLPAKGEPNSSMDKLNPDGSVKKRRYYGPDGKAELDVDYNHSNGDGSHTFPHEHTWDWSQNSPRQ